MKLEPKKIFVLQDGKYIELSYQEFQKIDVKEKVFLPLYGMLMEVSKEVYKDFYRHKRRQKYIDERAAKMGEVSYHALTTDETNGEEILKDPAEGVDVQAEKHIEREEIRKALFLLPKNDYELLHALYFEEKTERELAAVYSISQAAVHKRKTWILKKLKKFLEKIRI